VTTTPTRTVYRADHPGSYIRPPALRKARIDRAHGRISDAALREIEDQAILDVVNLQREVGMDVYTDGEAVQGHASEPDHAGRPWRVVHVAWWLFACGSPVECGHGSLRDRVPFALRDSIHPHIAVIVMPAVRPDDVKIAHRHSQIAVHLNLN
jgi:hypothetical protein